MTMPHERTRAVLGTRELLEQLRLRDDIPADVRKDAVWCLRHFPTASDLKVAGYATTMGGTENPFSTSPDYDEHKSNMLNVAAKDAATLSVFIAEPLTERMITAPRDGDTPEDVAQRQEYLDIITGSSKHD